MKNKTRVKLATKAYHAFKVIKGAKLSERKSALHSVGDYSFSLLLIWIEIESVLKLLRYYEKMTLEYPRDLRFINRNWLVLKNLYAADCTKYELILGSKSCALREVRNKIVHNGLVISEDDFNKYHEPALWVRKMLLDQVQPQEVYLSKRRRMRTLQ